MSCTIAFDQSQLRQVAGNIIMRRNGSGRLAGNRRCCAIHLNFPRPAKKKISGFGRMSKQKEVIVTNLKQLRPMVKNHDLAAPPPPPGILWRRGALGDFARFSNFGALRFRRAISDSINPRAGPEPCAAGPGGSR